MNPYVRRREDSRAHARDSPTSRPWTTRCCASAAETLGVICTGSGTAGVPGARGIQLDSQALRRATSRRRSHDLIAGFWEEFRAGALARVPEATAESPPR